jgi:serine/threonine protein kinase
MVSLADGDRVGDRYRLRKRLATGPMATVWEADDLELGRRVALKFVGPAGDAARLRREAHAGATLDHPNSLGSPNADRRQMNRCRRRVLSHAATSRRLCLSKLQNRVRQRTQTEHGPPGPIRPSPRE